MPASELWTRGSCWEGCGDMGQLFSPERPSDVALRNKTVVDLICDQSVQLEARKSSLPAESKCRRSARGTERYLNPEIASYRPSQKRMALNLNGKVLFFLLSRLAISRPCSHVAALAQRGWETRRASATPAKAVQNVGSARSLLYAV